MEHTLEQLQSGQLAGAKRVQLSCNLTTFPEALFSLADTLEILDLSNNQLTHLPNNFARFTRLKVFFASNNPFTVFPQVLGQCTQLEMIGFKSCRIQHIPNQSFPPALKWLILTNNQLQQLPNDIGACTYLQKLMLAGNQLQSLPNTLAHCQHLQLLRISANQLTHLPEGLLQMPRLAWLAFAGNPFVQPPAMATQLPLYQWSHLQINHLLGQGASGNIYHATYLPTNEQVAVKEFKGQVTSDGLPDDEINACILAGAHPHLVSVLGVVTQHPQQKQALVFDLIPSHYQILGITPTFESCTRDVYAPNTRFSTAQICTIAIAMAQVCTQLHYKKLSHGDVYAHNILINEQQHCIFGDFGAATIYQSLPTSYHLPLQQIEVRAFGYLLDDLLQHAETNTPSEGSTLHQLHLLRQQCLQHTVAERPLFAQILQQLLVGNTTA